MSPGGCYSQILSGKSPKGGANKIVYQSASDPIFSNMPCCRQMYLLFIAHNHLWKWPFENCKMTSTPPVKGQKQSLPPHL